MRTSIATVCLSGGLVQKMYAAAEAGFDGIEIFEPDLVAAPQSPEEIRALADRLGLSLDLYQPFRDAEGVDEEAFADVLHRAEAKFRLMRRLGIDLMLVCSNVGTATLDDDEVSAGQLRRLGELAAAYDIRLAYEALAWGRFVDDYRRSWRIVELADHPNVGVCLDSFHILSRGHDPKQIEEIPAEKIFFLQLADAPALSMDVLSWSRHHRLFPGEGSFDLPAFLAHVQRAGYAGPLSLEVFNDTFRQTDPVRTARQAQRSLRWLADRTADLLGDEAGPLPRLPEVAAPEAFDFVEIKAPETSGVEVLLEQLGFDFGGRHRSKQVRLWTWGEVRIVCNDQGGSPAAPRIAAVGFDVADSEPAAERAAALMAPPVHRRTYAGEQALRAFSSPDGTEVFCSHAEDWIGEFDGGVAGTSTERGSARIDHVNLVQPWHSFDEAVLFYTSVLSLTPQPTQEVAGPSGLVRSQVMSSPAGGVRLPLNLLPTGQLAGDEQAHAQHVALACQDIVGVVAAARERGLRPLKVPGNYYDDLVARFRLSEDFVATLRELDLLYDRDADGEYLHCYTETVGEVFFELVERRERYDGFGAGNAPVRLVSQAG
ncbi:4-hydroxyphenylpyruvate dioxygenase [Nocardioides luteus]|uniref:3-dehydroshikimate dehydratase n=1 Tax=Nocardioides luteus TaxID=1844 RepID=A0ABQ5T2P0_9ACTN|nr:sugar phosphate isomerase/epimerase and 4-hydroxyphenylpyruvate domain-containing protein [Nocardioides luteus]MDR7310244.1 4-hydroxyphenylpyruvate dioxygenase [Nocardioides luteus]GGR53959.1 4-hydroxyphenylpyruvate dioxygenase [Nocardioides luteus]GLJ69977.1 4-hydroxyphenylpyruvate dioxygenase [Nocardioides luteus]